MKTKHLLPYAATLGALTTLIFPVAGLFWAYSTWRGDLYPDGTPDDAPWRAATLLLYLSPVFFYFNFPRNAFGFLYSSYTENG